jgi:hypothetical protein
VPTNGEGHEKSCQQGDLEPNGREMASMRGEGQEPKSRAARPRILEAAGKFYFGLLLRPAVNRNLSPASAGLFYPSEAQEGPLV